MPATEPNAIRAPRSREGLAVVAGVLALAAVYFGAAKLGLSMAFQAEQVTAVWPPTGIALAAVLLFGYQVWPGIALGAFLANATTANESLATACGIAVGNTLEALIGAWLLRRFTSFANSLERLRDILGFVGLATVLSTAVSATVGVTSLCLGNVQPWASYGSLWLLWWLGDATGALVVAPVLLIWATRPGIPWQARRIVEGGALLAGVSILNLIVFTEFLNTSIAANGLVYTIFPFVIWAAMHFGQPGTTFVTLLASGISIWGTAHGHGPFAIGTANQSLMLLQSFMAAVAFTGLLLGAAITERNLTERRQAAAYAASQILAGAAARSDAIPRILRTICETLDWDFGAFWSVDYGGEVLRCAEIWHKPALKLPEFETQTRQCAFAPGLGLPGRVWASGEAAWIADVSRDKNFPRAATAVREGLRGAFAFPILLSAQRLGVMEFLSREIRRPDQELLCLMATVGSQIGQFLERTRAEGVVRQTEERQRQQLLELETLYETAPVGLALLDRDLRYVRINEALAAINGVPVSDTLGRRLREVVPQIAEVVEPVYRRVIESGQPVCGVEIRGTTRKEPGVQRDWVVSYYPLKGPGGSVVGVNCIVLEVSEQKRLYAELKEAARRKDEFLAMLAHELRNPLAPLRNALHVLRMRSGDENTVEHTRAMMERQVGHMTRLIDDLLDVSRITRGKVSLQMERLDLARLVRTSTADHRSAFEAAGLTVELDVPQTPVWVTADPTRLAQVLDNLLENARKFTDRRGKVDIKLSANTANKQVVLAVRDTGIGIEPELLRCLFDAFSQAGQRLDRARGGLGLGLAIAKGLMELHGGGIKAASGGLGRGAELTVWLPQVDAVPAPRDGPASCKPSPKPLRILVVEDNPDSAESLRMLLELYAYDVTLADSGPKAIEEAKRVRPDVVLCDIGLPGMDGFDVAKVLRQDPEMAHTRLVAVTGYGQEEDKRRALEAGFDDHLVKPADPEQLLGKLESSIYVAVRESAAH